MKIIVSAIVISNVGMGKLIFIREDDFSLKLSLKSSSALLYLMVIVFLRNRQTSWQCRKVWVISFLKVHLLYVKFSTSKHSGNFQIISILLPKFSMQVRVLLPCQRISTAIRRLRKLPTNYKKKLLITSIKCMAKEGLVWFIMEF